MGEVLDSIKALSKPLNTVIEKVSGAIGAWYEPTGIRRKAEAQADAQTIKEIQETGLTKEELMALKKEATLSKRKIENRTAIMEQAIPMFDSKKANPDNVDPDWFMEFSERAGKVSNKELQIIWAKILAGEVNKAGSFSLQTLNTIALIDKRIAQNFEILLRFTSDDNNGRVVFWYMDDKRPDGYQLSYEEIIELQSLGIVEYNFSKWTRRTLNSGVKNFAYSFVGLAFVVEPKPETGNSLGIRSIETGNLLLTNTGEQLASVCTRQPDPIAFQFIISQLRKKGYVVQEIESVNRKIGKPNI